MNGIMIVLIVLGLALVGWIVARARATRLQSQVGRLATNSRPSQHGWYVALWTAIPALLFLAVWAGVMPALVTDSVLATPQAQALPSDGFGRSSILGEAQAIANGRQASAFNPKSEVLVQPYRDALARFGAIGAALAAILAFAGGAYAFSRVSPAFKARSRIERLVMFSLLLASLIAILTTAGIVLSLLSNRCASSRWSIRSTSFSASNGARNRRLWAMATRTPLCRPALLGYCVHRRDHRHGRRHSPRADERNLPHPIC